MLRDRADRDWFSPLLRHLARKQSGSILTTLEPTRGKEPQNWRALGPPSLR